MSNTQQTRRSLLGAVPTLAVGLAGCVSGSSEKPPQSSNGNDNEGETETKYSEYTHVGTVIDEVIYGSLRRETIPAKFEQGDLIEIAATVERGYQATTIVADPDDELLDRADFKLETHHSVEIEQTGVHRVMFEGGDKLAVTVEHYRP